jgi:hypothetical protein
MPIAPHATGQPHSSWGVARDPASLPTSLMLSLANNPMTRSSYHYTRLIYLMQNLQAHSLSTPSASSLPTPDDQQALVTSFL